MKYSKEIQAKGHLVDSGIMSEIFDSIINNSCKFKVLEFKLGTTNTEESTTRIEVRSDSREKLDNTILELHSLGCFETKPVEITTKIAQKDKSVPSDFYSTTNHKTLIYYQGKWKKAKNQRMDSIIVIKNDEAYCTLLRDIKKGDIIVVGFEGVQVVPDFKERNREFSFMDNDVSSERKVAVAVSKLVNLMKEIKKNKGKIAVVAGPVVVHTGGTESLSKLIRNGLIDVLLSGNALAVHDIEQALLGTSLGIDTKTGIQVQHGHKNHMSAINAINTAGSIKEAVESGVLKSGIMYECVKNKVHYVLAGSLRDDGPLPDTEMDLIKAQKAYAETIKGVDLVLMLSTMLHSIATGNMLPSYVKTVCVDINPAVVTKLADRGSSQAIGIVTDVGMFLDLLNKELNHN